VKKKVFGLIAGLEPTMVNLKNSIRVVDALNFMGKEGWVFINAYPVFNGNIDIYHFAFKKQFTRAEVLGDQMN